ncbi:hypothetical protein Tco_0765229, partial [Tanacetum coccineum]
SWNEEPCRDVHEVGDEREVEVLRSFNWPPSELITKDGVLLERGDINEMKMEEYMAMTCTDNGARVVGPKIRENITFEIKGHVMKELADTPFVGTDEEDANENVEKGPIPKMAPVNAKKAILNMADLSQMWHDGANGRNRVMDNSTR